MKKTKIFVINIVMRLLDYISDKSISLYNYLAEKYDTKTGLIKF